MFKSVLYTIAKAWKQAKCPPTDMVHIYNGVLSTHSKKERNNAIRSNMDGTRGYLSQVSQKGKDKHHTMPLVC